VLHWGLFFITFQINLSIQALNIDPNHVISLGNRSACYLALSLYHEAEVDARRAIQLDRGYIKGYFRLATALQKSKQYTEASRIASMGLDVDPLNAALKKIKLSCSQEPTFSRNIFGNLYKDKTKSLVEKHSEDENISKKIEPRSQPTKETNAPPASFNGVERRMYDYLMGLMSRIQSGEFSSSDANTHMLQGTFRKLVEKETFSDALFPGVPLDVANTLPKNLRELFEWNGVDKLVLQEATRMTKSATNILEGVRVRGEARGDIMDTATETVLIPQIAQETFARAVVDIVRNLSKRASNLNARLNLTIASPQVAQASLDQLDDHIFEYLVNDEASAVQDTFLGEDWANLVLSDVIRYAKSEKMTDMSFLPHVSTLPRYEETHEQPRADPPVVSPQSMNDQVRIAWIESKETAVLYPALSEAIRNLHSLPYEINGCPSTIPPLPNRSVCPLIQQKQILSSTYWSQHGGSPCSHMFLRTASNLLASTITLVRMILD
jgi:hypothetical protein